MKKLAFMIAFWGVFSMGYAQGYDPLYPEGSSSTKDIPEPLQLPDFPMNNGDVIYQRVYDFDGASQEELFGISLRYVSEYYRSAKSVIDVTDPITGLVVVKGNFSVISDVYYRFFGSQKTQANQRTAHTLKIESRSGRIRVTIDNLVVTQEANPANGLPYVETPISDLIRDYRQYERMQADQKPKKGAKLQQVNRSIFLDELDLNAFRFLEELQPYFEKELGADW